MSQRVNLYSDTQTRPTPAMREAMARAEVGDEQRGEDPTTNALCERVAELLGKEAAHYLPSGAMCNLVALKTHTQPGDAVICERESHIVRAECGGAGLVSGVIIDPIDSPDGIFTWEQLAARIDHLSLGVYAPPAEARLRREYPHRGKRRRAAACAHGAGKVCRGGCRSTGPPRRGAHLQCRGRSNCAGKRTGRSGGFGHVLFEQGLGCAGRLDAGGNK